MENSLAVFNWASDVMNVMGRTPQSEEEQMAVVNALSSPNGGISDLINQEVELVNYYLEKTTLTDKDSGEVKETMRAVIITSSGESYGGCSKGLINSLKAIITVYGHAEAWKAPLKVKVLAEKVGKGTMYKLRVVK